MPDFKGYFSKNF